jgi:SAM-dependent methyltransferase
MLIRGRASYSNHDLISPVDYDRIRRGHHADRRADVISGVVRSEVMAGGTVVELGCGTGRTVFEVSNRVPDVHLLGVDISERLVAYAHEHYRGLRRRFRLLDVTEQWPHSPVDLAYSVDLIHQVPDWNRLFENVRRMLKNGHSWLAFEPNVFNPIVTWRQARMKHLGLGESHFLPWRARTMLAATGFRLVHRRTMLAYPSAVQPRRWARALERPLERLPPVGSTLVWQLRAV